MLLEITANDIGYQTVGIIALILTVISFQGKSIKKIMIMQGIGALFWATHFAIGHAYSGCIMNGLSFIRAICFIFILKPKGRKIFTIIISLCYIAAAVLSVIIFNELWFIAMITAMGSIVGNYFFCKNNEKQYRLAQLCFISPCWLFNNIWYLSIGGIICESMNMISVIVALIRFHNKKKTTENIENKQD